MVRSLDEGMLCVRWQSETTDSPARNVRPHIRLVGLVPTQAYTASLEELGAEPMIDKEVITSELWKLLQQVASALPP